MIYNIYCLKDTKVGFMAPYLQPNDAVAVRDFTTVMNDDSRSISVNYQDIELYRVGTFNMDNGEIVSSVQYLIKGVDVRKVGINE